MPIESIEQTLDEAERAALAAFEERFKRVAHGRHLDDWREMIPGLVILSRTAKGIAGATERRGAAYNRHFAELVFDHARKVSNRVSLKEIKGMMQSFSYLLWLSEGQDRLAVLDAELEKLPLNRRTRINAPLSAYKLVKAVEDARAQAERPQEQAKAKAQAERPKPESLGANLLSYFPPQLRKNAEVLAAVKAIAASFDAINAAHVEQRIEQVYGERAAAAKRIIQDANRKHPFTQRQFKDLLLCVHPDNPASPEVRNRTTRLVKAREHMLAPEEDTPKPPPLPVDPNELQARKRTHPRS